MKRHRVLLVEDSPKDGRELVGKLVRADCDVTLECDGIAAIRRVHEATEPFDVVVLDIQRSLVQMRYTASVLRAIGFAGQIVTMSTCNDSGTCADCFASGCNDCIPRNSSAADLLTSLENWSTGRRSCTSSLRDDVAAAASEHSLGRNGL